MDLRRRRLGRAGITVSIYGGGPERRVESGTGTIRETGPAPIRRRQATRPCSRATASTRRALAAASSVTRTVYNEEGEVIYDETWNTSYRGEYRVIRVGTKPPPKPEPKPKDKPKAPPCRLRRRPAATTTQP